MIERIIEFSIRNRFLVLMLTAVLAIAGVFAMFDTPVDAVPDQSENQVIVFTDWMGRSPREIEDQITYPLSRKLQGLAGVRTVRSSSEFNFSMITIIFDDNIDFYFARQRVTEKLAQANVFLPSGVVPYLAPDATALGQIFWYTVESSAENKVDPERLWALNKFYIAPQINAAPGVADVAIVGGAPLEYQIDVRPEALRAYGITLGDLYSAVSRSNMPASGGVIQKNNAEYIVRSVGWLKDKSDIEDTVIKEVSGTPIYVRTVASVSLGTQYRRSVYEKEGNEVTGGAVLMRHGQNPLEVTRRIKERIGELQAGLPAGVHIVPAYDRTRLITGAIHTLTDVMGHEMIIASVAILLILVHVRSVFVICITLPLAVLFSFLLMWVLRRLGIIDIQANIMSLAGITISIGILVDQAIVMTENATHHLKEHFGDRRVTGDTRELVVEPCRTVGRPIFFSVLIMLLSFVPVFMLSGREGKLFHPLAFTKSFAMIGVALISITVVPALIPSFIRGRLRSEEENPIVRSFIHIYKPLLTWALPRRNLVMWAFAALLLMAAGMFPLQALIGLGASRTAWEASFLAVFGLVTALTVISTRGFKWQVLSLASLIWVGLWAFHFDKIGVTFMPPLDEGTTLDMPVTIPRASITQVADDLKARDALLRGFPEVESVIGKAGRADTPTDPAPLEMVETFVNFRPKELWPKRVLRFDDAQWQVERTLNELQQKGYVQQTTSRDDPHSVFNAVNDRSIVSDATKRSFESALGPALTRLAIEPHMNNLIKEGAIVWPEDKDKAAESDRIVEELAKKYGARLTRDPKLEDLTELDQALVEQLAALELPPPGGAAVEPRRSEILATLLEPIRDERSRLWSAHTQEIETGMINNATQNALTRFDETMRALALERYEEVQHSLEIKLTRFAVAETIGMMTAAGQVHWPEGLTAEVEIDRLTGELKPGYGVWLSKNPSLEDAAQLSRDVAGKLKQAGAIDDVVRALEPVQTLTARWKSAVAEAWGTERPTFAGQLLAAIERQRTSLWHERVRVINWELFDRGMELYSEYALEEIAKLAVKSGLSETTAHGKELQDFSIAAINVQLDKPHDARAIEALASLRDSLQKPLATRAFLWPRQSGPKGDLVDDEMGRVLQMPGWANIFIQPIINRIEMLSTGVRNDIGVKVFGADLDTINRVSKDIEAAIKPINGARDVVAAQIMGKGYLQIDIDRKAAARYGISVADIQNEIEVALAGRAVTYTVENRDRFPVRIRYVRSQREDEENIRKLLIAANSMAPAGGDTTSTAGSMSGGGSEGDAGSGSNSPDAASHAATPAHAGKGKTLIPLGALAAIKIVEGPAMIKSENGQLLNYVTLNVRGRDIVGFVDEAQRVVAEKVKVPEGVHIGWTGEFEHQVRAARTLRFVFPAVIAVIFIVLYMTYNDLADAGLMMMAVPEALAGGAFFLYLFPKITQGWSAPPMDFSVAVWVGFIACFGMATETGIIMLVYLREAIDKRGGLETIESLAELREAVIEGAVHRLRPKLLTEGVAIIAIFPMVFATGVGGEILAPMALPVLGGLLISDEVVDLFLPVRFYWVRRARWLKLHKNRLASPASRRELSPLETTG